MDEPMYFQQPAAEPRLLLRRAEPRILGEDGLPQYTEVT